MYRLLFLFVAYFLPFGLALAAGFLATFFGAAFFAAAFGAAFFTAFFGAAFFVTFVAMTIMFLVPSKGVELSPVS